MKLLDIGEVAKLSGVKPSTLRYYEEKGLIQSLSRSGLRRFGPVACRTAFVRYEEACAPWTVARTAAETGIAAEDILRAAETLIAAKRVAYYCWSGVGQHREATQTDRAIALLMALKGGYDRRGGNVAYEKHPMHAVTDFNQFPAGQIEKALGYQARPLGPPSQGWVTARDL